MDKNYYKTFGYKEEDASIVSKEDEIITLLCQQSTLLKDLINEIKKFEKEWMNYK